MSRDDVILVAYYNYVYYVLHANASYDWDDWEKLITVNSPYTYSRVKALLIAHNKQKKLQTEYGVFEVS